MIERPFPLYYQNIVLTAAAVDEKFDLSFRVPLSRPFLSLVRWIY
jgi:hypothetical protein